MKTRTKQKILATILFYFLWIVTGTFELLPSFTSIVGGGGHSMVSLVTILMDLVIYIVVTHALVTVIFWTYDEISSTR